MLALGIESSCDETAAAVVELPGRILSNVVHGQVEVHERYGGVVPELASRAHARHVQPVIAAALTQAGVTPGDLDCVAVTIGPGLIGGLLTGLAAAKGFALGAGLPLVGVHHMEGHLLSPFLDAGQPGFDFPFVALLVSGGHTLLLHARAFGEYLPLGQTRDDAVGEAFDKGARLLGLGYPGGPAIARLAEGGDPAAVHFPRALPEKKELDFSFSGLKTALRTFLARHPQGGIPPRDVAASYQEAIVDVLTSKSLAACRAVGERRLVVAGGVGANTRLREVIRARAAGAGIEVCFPSLALCTDNGAMIALAGLRRWRAGERGGVELDALARWPVERLLREKQPNA
ncbi:MAG: tRNA (adenosine(37)-N6)-threonylcarbamoyltransferase complex transferase subunit TsaD [Magnetococcales bacterium]|nr:tRNA (adenosine(37)-N6)-threonylcarbamoyltransferase complex transferase subunit TsaD [Magnetococcales bacterium]